MNLVLDASMALAWCITRANPDEAALAQQLIASLSSFEISVPFLWYAEVTNTLLVFERAKRLGAGDSDAYLANLAYLSIREDDSSSAVLQSYLLAIGRKYQLTAYDAHYFELAYRKHATLATFDQKLAAAARAAGIPLFGDPS